MYRVKHYNTKNFHISLGIGHSNRNKLH